MTFLELMEKEIVASDKALTIREALELAEKDGSINQIPNYGKTPQKTINSLLHKDIKRGEMARFVQVSLKPARFDIKK